MEEPSLAMDSTTKTHLTSTCFTFQNTNSNGKKLNSNATVKNYSFLAGTVEPSKINTSLSLEESTPNLNVTTISGNLILKLLKYNSSRLQEASLNQDNQLIFSLSPKTGSSSTEVSTPTAFKFTTPSISTIFHPKCGQNVKEHQNTKSIPDTIQLSATSTRKSTYSEAHTATLKIKRNTSTTFIRFPWPFLLFSGMALLKWEGCRLIYRLRVVRGTVWWVLVRIICSSLEVRLHHQLQRTWFELKISTWRMIAGYSISWLELGLNWLFKPTMHLNTPLNLH